ncbi:hypothetical protein QLX08_002446 [Tetragonisca angustula]|uniref:D-isomer specific 2-hydroxyacid dehydrogenase NAD-binding domain-containing protein n=1 Tax=Tetragonisca angustula TaxID=166442 RepID=A0AAW1AAQ1_9HYME
MAQSIAILSVIPRLSYHLRMKLPNSTIFDVLPDKCDTLSKLQDADIVVTDCNLFLPYTDKLPSVKWVQTTWAGIESLISNLRDKKINYTLTRFSDKSLALAMSEYIIAHIFNFERNQRQQYQNQENKEWITDGNISDYKLISDLSVGILGLGNIGKTIAEKIKMFGATVWGMTRTPLKESLNYIDEHRTIEHLPEVLTNCRGTIIKETDLLNALEQQWILGAILDVFAEEPLSGKSKLWSLPQVTITPHISGVSRARDIADYFVQNYQRYIKGEKLLNIANLEEGY